VGSLGHQTSGDATGGIKSLGSLGTAGQILTSQGAGLPPIWSSTGFASNSFQVYMSASQNNVTGDGTYYTLPFDVAEFNYGTPVPFDLANHWFEVTVSGIYQIVYTVYFRVISPFVGFNNCCTQIVRFRPSDGTTRTYIHDNINPSPITDNTTPPSYEYDSCNTDICEFIAGDRVYLQGMVGNATRTVGFTGFFVDQLRTRMCGWLLHAY
jgi:hypothetical protein